jgi:hypothetical protein
MSYCQLFVACGLRALNVLQLEALPEGIKCAATGGIAATAASQQIALVTEILGKVHMSVLLF